MTKTNEWDGAWDGAREIPICRIKGCGRIVEARGWCSYHYDRWHKYGNPEEPLHQVGGNKKGMATKQGPRPFAILASDHKGTWRIWDTTAISHEEAVRKYRKIFSYTVLGVGLLGGSGHPIKWQSDV